MGAVVFSPFFRRTFSMVKYMNTFLTLVKTALRISVDAFDSELEMLIEAAEMDLGIAGVIVPEEYDSIVKQAIITYCKMNFGNIESSDYTKLKASYDEQKAQLVTATGYTNWLGVDE